MRAVGVVMGALVMAIGPLLAAPPALAAFPGANGLLAVQPVSGGGILLVQANGNVVRRICTVKQRCGTPREPRWSPDGRAIVFAGPAIRIVYTDGSCMNCQFGAAANPVFKPGGTVISFIQGHRHVTFDGIDAVREPAIGLGVATDAVWSADGQLAVVRDGWLWVGRPGKLHRLAPGSEPSWSPSRDRIVAVQRGWVVIVRVGDRHVQRLARGGAPAFSPDGRWIAYVAPDHRLMIVAAGGGRSRPVGHLQALSVDWQPRPAGPNPGCAAPPGSTVLAGAPDAIVTQDGPGPPFGFTFAPAVAYMGCLSADGRERLLERFTGNNVDNASWVKSAVLAAPYTALVEHSEDEHYGGAGDSVQVFDLRSGQLRKDLGGEAAGCPDFGNGLCGGMDQLVLGRDGVSAVHLWTMAPVGTISTPLLQDTCAPASTVCLAVDGRGALFASPDPRAGGQGWASSTLSASGLPFPVACPSRWLCVGAAIGIYTTSDPTGGANTWRSTALPGTQFFADAISCPTVSLCVVTRADGSVATSTDPSGGSQAWAIAKVASSPLRSVICSAKPQCFIADGTAPVFTSSNPTGGPGAWTVSATTPLFQSGACPTTNLCVTVDGSRIATTTDPSAATWTRQTTADSLDSVSCPTASLCVAVGAGGALDVSTDPPSGAWTHATIDLGRSLDSISCSSASLCVATDDKGHVVVSTNPPGGDSAWIPTLIDGDPCVDTAACSIESIEASDQDGAHSVDNIELPGAGPFLTGLTLNGDTLSWSHDGSPHATTLTPP